MATIEEVARRAGVSTASVSRALNGKPGIGKETRERILRACAEMNYSPDAAARKLSFGNQAVVALLLNEWDAPFSPFVSTVLRHLFGFLQRRGMVPEIVRSEDIESVPSIAGSAMVIAREPHDKRVAYLQENGLPVISIGKKSDGFWIAPDDYHGAFSLTRLVLDSGKTRPAFIEKQADLGIDFNLRAQGYKSACFAAHLTPELILFESTHFQGISAAKFFLENWERLSQYDAYICNTDEIAFGVLAALELKGIQIPNEKAVTGFDDLPGITSNLTTARQNFRDMAEKSVELLSAAIEAQQPRGIVLDVEIIERTTV